MDKLIQLSLHLCTFQENLHIICSALIDVPIHLKTWYCFLHLTSCIFLCRLKNSVKFRKIESKQPFIWNMTFFLLIYKSYSHRFPHMLQTRVLRLLNMIRRKENQLKNNFTNLKLYSLQFELLNIN